MAHYICKLQFSIVVSNASLAEQFEEQIILVEAGTREEAYQKALACGRQNEDEFVNNNRNYVRWELIGITHLFQLNALTDGAVLFSELRDDYNNQQQQAVSARIERLKKTFDPVENPEY